MSDTTRSACVARTVRRDVQATHAYKVADATGMVKLDAMENPYTLPPELHEGLVQRLLAAELNRYPTPSSPALEKALRAATALPDQAGIVFGNGSDEIISLLIQTLCEPGDVVLSPIPTFVMYAVSSQWAHARFVGVPLNSDFSLDMPAMRQAIEQHRPKLVFLAYPNNPTGNAFSPSDIDAILDIAPGLVVVDEAYEAFASDSYAGKVLERPNLMVLRTLSKQGLAGIRLGYGVAHPDWTVHIDKVRPPYNINVLTRACAQWVLEHQSVLAQQALALREQRTELLAQMRAMPGVQAFDSEANFVLFRVPDAPRVFESLKIQGILIKNVSGMHPLLSHCLRVTVSSPEENALFLSALRKALSS